MHVTTYIAKIIAVWTIIWTRRGAHSDRFQCGSTHPITTHPIIILKFVATAWQRAVEDFHHQVAQHRSSVHKPEPTVVHAIWRTRDCIPPGWNNNNTLWHNATHIILIHAWGWYSNDRSDTGASVRPITVSSATIYANYRQRAAMNHTRNSFHSNVKLQSLLFYITSQNLEIYRTGADSRRQPDSAGSTRHGHVIHHSKNNTHANMYQQLHRNSITHHIIPQINQTPKLERSAERQLRSEDRLHSAVHRSTALRGMLSDSRVTVAPSKTTYGTRIQCIMFKLQRGNILFI